MKILVLGGGGFIGSTICDRLLNEGHSLKIFERPGILPYRNFTENENVEWIAGDYASEHDIKNALIDVKAVYHLISTTLPKNSNDDPCYDARSNILPTLQLLTSMVEFGIRKIIFISSGGTVYGIPQSLPIDEFHPLNPIVAYGVSKLAIEKYLHMFQYLRGIEPVILRVSNPYGESQRLETAQGVVAAFLYRSIYNKPIEIWGDGTIIRDYIYVGDVADAFAAALTYEGEQRIMNISSGVGISLNELIALVAKATDKTPKIIFKQGRSFDIKNNVLCNKLAKSNLNWVPKIDLEEGLKRTARWFLLDQHSSC